MAIRVYGVPHCAGRAKDSDEQQVALRRRKTTTKRSQRREHDQLPHPWVHLQDTFHLALISKAPRPAAVDQITGAAALGSVGLDWQLGGFAADPPSSDGSTSQLVQAMAVRRRVKTEGYHRWTESEIEQFEAQHMIGSRARLAFALLLYTGQRRSDVVRMGRQHIRDGALQVRYRRVCHCNQRREQTRQTVRRQHTCVRRGAASVQSRRYHKNLLCAEWAAQWCTERPLLARRLLAKPLPHIPEVSRRVTAAEFGADAKLDVAAL